MSSPPTDLALDGGPTDQDRPPRGGAAAKPVPVFLSRAQHQALLDQAEEEGELPSTVMRRALRLYLAAAASVADDAGGAA